MEKQTIRGRSVAFYVILGTIVFCLIINIASLVAFFQTKNIIFLIELALFSWMIYSLIKIIRLEEIYFTPTELFFKSVKKRIYLKEIKSVQIASAKDFREEARLDHNTYILNKLSRAKTYRSYAPGSQSFFPMWMALKYQPYIHIIYKQNKQFLYNIDPYTKRSISELIRFLGENNIPTEVRV